MGPAQLGNKTGPTQHTSRVFTPSKSNPERLDFGKMGFKFSKEADLDSRHNTKKFALG
jgi:hypothetical protein